MSLDVFKQLVLRIKEHVLNFKIKRLSISFHGGEPLLRKPSFFKEAAEICRNEFYEKCIIDLGVQTNATLLSLEHIKVFKEYGILVGTSLDGSAETNNMFRIHKNGNGSHDDAIKGISLLRLRENRSVWGGNLAVINVKSSPAGTLAYLSSLNPPMLDFLEPDGHWEKIPHGKHSAESTEYADWLIEAFDVWFDGDTQIPIRRFEAILQGMVGASGSVEYFGTEPVSLITIATDGAYEAVDQIKVVGDGIEKLHLNVFENTLDSVFEKKLFLDRQGGVTALSDECQRCEFKQSCGGGYYPHRFSKKNGFLNPSIYCADYKKLFLHIKNKLQKELNED